MLGMIGLPAVMVFKSESASLCLKVSENHIRN